LRGSFAVCSSDFEDGGIGERAPGAVRSEGRDATDSSRSPGAVTWRARDAPV